MKWFPNFKIKARRSREFSKKFFKSASPLMDKDINDAITRFYGFTAPELIEIIYFAKQRGYGVIQNEDCPMANAKMEDELRSGQPPLPQTPTKEKS